MLGHFDIGMLRLRGLTHSADVARQSRSVWSAVASAPLSVVLVEYVKRVQVLTTIGEPFFRLTNPPVVCPGTLNDVDYVTLRRQS